MGSIVTPLLETYRNQGLALMSHRERDSSIWYHSESDRVFKTAPKYLIDNEFHWLMALSPSGYVPAPISRPRLEVISMPYIHNQDVTEPESFMDHLERVLDALRLAGCRHGDLTAYSVLVHHNKPVIIDFGESRHWGSPLPDKREEGDRYWLTETMRRLAYGK